MGTAAARGVKWLAHCFVPVAVVTPCSNLVTVKELLTMVMQMIKIWVKFLKKKMFPVTNLKTVLQRLIIRCGFKLSIAVMAYACNLFHMQMQILVTN